MNSTVRCRDLAKSCRRFASTGPCVCYTQATSRVDYRDTDVCESGPVQHRGGRAFSPFSFRPPHRLMRAVATSRSLPAASRSLGAMGSRHDVEISELATDHRRGRRPHRSFDPDLARPTSDVRSRPIVVIPRGCNAGQVQRTICLVFLGATALGGCADAPTAPLAQQSVAQRSCSAEIGVSASAALVKQCVQVSPATQPPCNTQNSCTMIRDEIKRGCDTLAMGSLLSAKANVRFPPVADVPR